VGVRPTSSRSIRRLVCSSVFAGESPSSSEMKLTPHRTGLLRSSHVRQYARMANRARHLSRSKHRVALIIFLPVKRDVWSRSACCAARHGYARLA
jgi:hypothetical protein